MRYSCRRKGFTLVELLISMAITGILTAVVFTSLAQERSRTALKNLANQVQSDLQGLQNNVLTGLIAPAMSCLGGSDDRKICSGPSGTCPVCQYRPPRGWGFRAVETGTNYTLYADMPGSVAGAYDTTGVNIDALVGTKSLETNLTVHQITYSCATCPVVNPTDVDITFSGVKGDATICIQPGPACNQIGAILADSVSIVFRHSRLNLCYAVTVRTVGGIVTKRQTTTCS